jgi:hypothetical protein
MRHTILHALLVICAAAGTARAQTPPVVDEAFAAGRWHVEAEGQAALEAWNYNGSHEDL